MLGTYSGRQLLGIRYLPPFPYFMDSPNAFRVLPGRLRHHRRRHRHRAHGTGLRRGRQGDRRRRGHRRRHAGRLQGPVRRDGARLRGPARLRRQPADHPRPEERHGSGGGQRCGAAAARDLRPLLPALLAVPEPADLPGGVVVVHQGHRVPRPHGRTQPADHLVPRTRQGRPVRQVAVECARLVDLAKPLLGQSDSGVEVRRSGLPADRRVRQPRRARARLRRAPGRSAPALHRRADPAQPRRPDRQVDHAAHRGRLRRLVRLRVDAVRAGALPVRERRVVRRRTIPPTSSSSTSGRPAAGSTCCTCWPRRCSTGPRSRRACPTASCWAATARR